MKGFALCLEPPLPGMIPFAKVPAVPFHKRSLDPRVPAVPFDKGSLLQRNRDLGV